MAASAIAGLISAIGTTIAAGGITNLAFGVYANWAAFAAVTAAFTALSAISRSLMDAPTIEAMTGINFNSRDPRGTRKIIYGECRIGGTCVFIGSSTPVGEADNKLLHIVIALAGHSIESIDEIYLNEEKAWDASSGLVAKFDGAAQFFLKPSGGNETTLTSEVSEWTSDHDLWGTAYIHARFDYEGNEDVWTSGVPNISCVVKGKKIFDPREAGHDIDNSSTWEYSNNPALCLYDYMRDDKYGLGEDAANIDQTALIASANICDEDVEINSIGSGVTQKRYTCDGVLDTKASIKSNIETILTGMIGACNYASGKFFINAYAHAEPQTTVISESMLVAPIQLVTRQSRRNLYNAVKGQFISEEENYTLADYPAQIGKTDAGSFVTGDYYYITDVGSTVWTGIGASANTQGIIFKATGAGSGTGKASAYAGADGEIIYLDMNLPMTKNNKRAQRIAKLTMLKSRLQAKIKMTLNMEGMKYKVGDNVKVTNARLGYDEKEFEVDSYRLLPNEGGINVEIEATENASAAYDWLTTDEVDFTTSAETTLYDGTTCIAPTALNITPSSTVMDDGSIQNIIDIDWTASLDAFVDHYEIDYKPSASSVYAQDLTKGSLVPSDVSRDVYHKIKNLPPNTAIDIRVRAVNERGVKSAYLEGTSAATPADYTPKVPSIYRLSKSGSAAPTEGEFTTAAGRDPKDKDVVITTDTSTTPDATHVWYYNLSGTAWVEDNNLVSGDSVIDGSITGTQIKAESVTANKFSGAVTEHSQFYYDYIQSATSSYTTWALAGAPATELGISKNRSLECVCEFSIYNASSTVTKYSVNAKLQVEVPASSPSYFMGDCYYSSTPASNFQWVYATGDYTNSSGTFGYVSVTTAPTTLAAIEGCYYDATNNRTYFLLFKYGSPLVTASGGSHEDLTYHPYGTSAAGAWVDVKSTSPSWFTKSGTSYANVPIKANIGERSEAINFRIQIQSYPTGISAQEVSGSITSRM
jgi:hypothetical protein